MDEQQQWLFQEASPCLVAYIPDGKGNFALYRVDETVPTSTYQREQVRALIRVAEERLSEPPVMRLMDPR